MLRLPYRVKVRLPRRLLHMVAPPRSALTRMAHAPLSLDGPEFRRVLVVAPHPDDESLGCGGLIARLVDGGRDVHILVMCDGSGSHRGSKTHPASRLVAVRQAEARAAARTLGIAPERVHFLGVPDGSAPFQNEYGFADARDALCDLIAGHAIGTVTMPWRRDGSRDHHAVWQVVRAAAAAGATRPRLLEYPIWAWADEDHLPKPGEVLVWRLPMSASLDRKRRAIGCHRTQLGGVVTDDPRSIELNKVFLLNFDLPWEPYFEDLPAAAGSPGPL